MCAQGIDISRYQHQYDPTVKEHDFVLIRATIHLATDDRFEQHVESISDVPIRRTYP
jgi:hypothetical protein